MTNKTRQTGDAKNIKVALFQPALPKYRIPVFNALGASPGIELTVLPSPKLAGSSLPQADGAETFEVVWAPMYRKGPFFRQPGLHEELKPGRFDVVIFSWYTRNLDLGKAIRRARQLGMPVALWGHGYSKNESAWRTFLRNRQARRADALIFYNNTARDKLIKHSFRPETLFVAANTLDQGPIQAAREYWLQHPDELKRFQQEHELENRPAVIYVSRLEPDNHVDWLIRAFPMIRERVPGSRLIIVGDGSQREELQSLSSYLGVKDAVTFTGAIYDDMKLAPWMLSSTVFCYPTNIGLSLLHAWGYGLPAVTSDATEQQNPEIEGLRPGENGLTWKHADFRNLAEVLAGVMSDRENARRMGEAGHRLATEHYTIERMISGFTDCINYLASLRK